MRIERVGKRQTQIFSKSQLLNCVQSRRSSQHDQMEAARLQLECKSLQEQIEALTNQMREAKKEYRESVEESEKRLIEAERELSGKRMHHGSPFPCFELLYHSFVHGPERNQTNPGNLLFLDIRQEDQGDGV